MVKITAVDLPVLASPLMALFTLTSLAAGTVSASASTGQALFDPSGQAVGDIPPLWLDLYAAQALACPGLPWQVLAGLAKVESNHGQYGGASIDTERNIRPPIIGIPLNGTNGTDRIRETDGGRYDGDRTAGRRRFRVLSAGRISGSSRSDQPDLPAVLDSDGFA